jgi:hypothetical protein
MASQRPLKERTLPLFMLLAIVIVAAMFMAVVI